MKIGNIVYLNELVNHEFVSYVNYYNKPLNYNEIINALPTLYVGWEFTKDFVNLNIVDILNYEIIPNKLYWTFDFHENKSFHIKGVYNFVNKLPNYYFKSNYNYLDYDPLILNIKTIDDLILKIPNNFDFLYCYKNEYVFFLKNDNIGGINLNYYKFLNFDILLILNLLKEKTNIYFFNDIDGNLFNENFKLFNGYDELMKYLIVILVKNKN